MSTARPAPPVIAAQPAPPVAAPPDAAPVAEPAAVPPDAPPAPPADPIADAVKREDWAGALAACAQATSPSVDVRTKCGIAACIANKRAVALRYHQDLPRSGQLTVQRACAAHGITLVAAPVKPRGPDPCDVNPLKCQK
jgi:hypothetical protein